MTTRTTTYDTEVRSFSHAHLAAVPAYARLRQALSDFANEAPRTALGAFLDALRDMAATAPFGDMCDTCGRDHPQEYDMYWPHAAERDGGWITGTYRCRRGHTWTCGYSIDIIGMF